jgi:hypothetical protein
MADSEFQKKFEEVVEAIVAITPRTFENTYSDIFQAFRRAVPQAATCKHEGTGFSLLRSVPSRGKLEVLTFLVTVAEKKKALRNQLITTLNTLLKDATWAGVAQFNPEIEKRLVTFDAGLANLISQAIIDEAEMAAAAAAAPAKTLETDLCSENKAKQLLQAGIIIMRALDWQFVEKEMDKSADAFRTFMKGVTLASEAREIREYEREAASASDDSADSYSEVPVTSSVLEACAGDAANVFKFLASFRAAKEKTHRKLVDDVIKKMVKYSPTYRKVAVSLDLLSLPASEAAGLE